MNHWSAANLLEPAEVVVQRERAASADPTQLYRYIARHYSFAVPNPEVLSLVARYSPLIDVGAGNGYWAKRLEMIGADVIAVEPNPHVANPVFPTICVDYTEVSHYPERTLLMVWPTKNHSWGAEAIRLYTGSTVAYIGDPHYAVTGTPMIRQRLEEKGFHCTIDWPLNSWPHFLNDTLQIWEHEEKAAGLGADPALGTRSV
jgi:hypothetical protein